MIIIFYFLFVVWSYFCVCTHDGETYYYYCYFYYYYYYLKKTNIKI